MLKSKLCETNCPINQFADPERKCQDCHSTCSECTGPLQTNCTECRDKANSVLNEKGQCIDCLLKPELDPVACEFNVKIELQKPIDKYVNPNASMTVRITFLNEQKFSRKLTAKHLSESLILRVSSFSQDEFSQQIYEKDNYYLLDLYFSKSADLEVRLSVTPIKNVILKNRVTQANELIFRNDSASISITANKAPDLRIVASLASTVESSAKISSSTSMISSALSVVALVSSSGLGAPLMKFFKIFKLVSRLRLINIDFGTFLELFLSFCNSIFMIGGDNIDKEALLANPKTRGKLNKYKVTVLSVEVISLQYAVYWMILVARYYRIKVRRYVPDKNNLIFIDKLTNLVAESGRVLLLTLIGIDVFFYSIHCVSHIDQETKLTLSGFISFWLSFVTIIALNIDFLMMINDNSTTTFISLREKFRKEANLKILLEKSRSKVDSPDQLPQIGTTGREISLSFAKDQKVEKEGEKIPPAETVWNLQGSCQEEKKEGRNLSGDNSDRARATQIIKNEAKNLTGEKSKLGLTRKINNELLREKEIFGGTQKGEEKKRRGSKAEEKQIL